MHICIFFYIKLYIGGIILMCIRKGEKKYANMHTYFGEHILLFQSDASYLCDNNKKRKRDAFAPLLNK